MKRISLQYYALLREQRGLADETLETDADTPGRLYEELRNRYGFPGREESFGIAINDTLAMWEDELSDGDTVVFLLPFGGG